MERIVLEVDSSLAKAWREIPIALKIQLTRDMESRIADQIRIAEKSKFDQALTGLRSQAETNGLTQELLENLLREED